MPAELAAVRNHGLPVRVVRRVREPFVPDRVGRAVDLVQVAVGAPARVPRAVRAGSSGPVVVGGVVQRLGVGGVEGPGVDEVPDDVAFHRHVERRRHRRADHDRLERRRPVLGRGPRRHARVAAAVHAHPAVAPRLPADPLDQRRGVRAVVDVRHGRVGAARLAAREAHDRGVAVRGRSPRLADQGHRYRRRW